MAIFNSYVKLPEGIPITRVHSKQHLGDEAHLTADGASGPPWQAFALQEGHEKKRGNNVLVLETDILTLRALQHGGQG
jgi:hypothetical protein